MPISPLFGPYGTTDGDVIEQLAQYGANAVWFGGFDPAAFESCERNGIAPCVKLSTFRAAFDKRPELIPIGVDGQPIRYGPRVQGVCLSQKAFLDEIEERLVSGLRAHHPTGIWLDYLAYAGWFETPDPDLQENCFCPQCVAEFCEATGIDATTPDRILDTFAERWMRHKCERLARFAAHYAGLIRSHVPDCLIGAYMCPWAPDEFGGALTRIFAQDYELLAPAIDVFTPLIYAQKSGRPASWGRDFLVSMSPAIPRDRKVQLILDVLDFPDSLMATAESSCPSWGIQLYDSAEVFRDPDRARNFQRAVERISRMLS